MFSGSRKRTRWERIDLHLQQGKYIVNYNKQQKKSCFNPRSGAY